MISTREKVPKAHVPSEKFKKLTFFSWTFGRFWRHVKWYYFFHDNFMHNNLFFCFPEPFQHRSMFSCPKLSTFLFINRLHLLALSFLWSFFREGFVGFSENFPEQVPKNEFFEFFCLVWGCTLLRSNVLAGNKIKQPPAKATPPSKQRHTLNVPP